MKNVILVGMGHQMVKDHIPAIEKMDGIKIVAAVDKDSKKLDSFTESFSVKTFSDISEIKNFENIDMAIVCVPHNQYAPICEILAKNKIATLREKPAAINSQEMATMIAQYRRYDTYLQVCVQRRFSRIYESAKSLIKNIGKIYSIHANYTMCVDEMSGWRGIRKIMGGGVVIDMGYHMIDLLTYLFGRPDRVYAQLSYQSKTSNYDTEDTAKILLSYNNNKINADVFISSVFDNKGEAVKILGDNGAVYISGRQITLYDKDFNELEAHSFMDKKGEMERQLNYFTNTAARGWQENILLHDQRIDMELVDAIYKSAEIHQVIKLGEK